MTALQFTRDGARLLVRGADGVQLLDTGGGPPISLARGPVEDAAVVGAEIWIVEGGLTRFDARGRALGARPLWGGPGEGRLIAASAAALWTAAPPAIVAADREPVRVPADADFVLPVSATRWLACRRDQLVLGEPGAERWRASLIGDAQRVVDGAVLFDGRAAALITADDRGQPRQVLVVALHGPVVQHRLTLVDVDEVRLAALRGFVLFRAGARLTMVDLRFGRVVGEHTVERALRGVAIDPSARTIALRWADPDELVVASAGELFAAPSAPAAPAVAPIVAEAREPAAPVLPAPAPSEDFHRGPALAEVTALVPRRAPPEVAPARADALLQDHLAVIRALAGRAIARAWDNGTLCFPTDGGLPYRTEVGGLLGHHPARAPEDLTRATADVVRARDARAAGAGGATPLTALADEFGLSEVACEILIAVAAPALWGEMARLYGILANDDARELCDEQLLCQLFADTSRGDLVRELDKDGPLVRHGLVRIADGMRPFAALTVEPAALRRLRGRDASADLDDVRIVHASCGFADFLTPAAIKAQLVHKLAARAPAGPPRLVIRGRIGAGRHTLLAILAEAAGRTLGVIDATPIIRELRTRADQLRAALRRAHLLGVLPCLDGLEHIASDDQVTRETVRELLRAHPGPLAIRLPWDAEPVLEPGYLAIDLPTLTAEQRITAWRAALARRDVAVADVPELAVRYSVGVGVMMRAADQVAGEPGDATAAVEAAVRQHLVTRLRATAGRVNRLATWSQVILPTDVQGSLLELIARIKHHSKVYDAWGLDAVAATARGVTALFQGGPGTGKTLVATAIANELGMDLYRVDLSRIMSKWIGETEQNLAKLFDAAEDGHAIILFDEADSLFARRTEVKTSVDRYANLEVNFLLQRLDSFEGIAILTTNFGTAIDTAFKRRLSFRLTFPFPDEDMRERLWRAHLPAQLPTAGDFDLGLLARRFRLSGGYIRNAVLRAAFLAAEEHVPLGQAHLEHAIRAEFSEIGKLSESGVLE